jgi:hypothetical protein
MNDLTGDMAQLVQSFAKLEFQPEGTYQKSVGRQGNVAIVKCPSFVALGFANVRSAPCLF